MTLLEVALDLESPEAAIKMAEEVKEAADILEVGTFLLKSAGISIVERLRKVAADKLLLVDNKTMDCGQIEARMVFSSGGDIMTICGAGPLETVISAIEESRRWNKKVLVDMIGVPESELVERARQFIELGASWVGVHAGADQQAQGKTPLSSLKLLAEEIPSYCLAVAGGLKLGHIQEIMRYKPGIVVIGGSITKSANPGKAAREFKEKIRECERKGGSC